MLLRHVSSQSKLTILKNNGGLNRASDDVITLCHFTEKVIRQFKDKLLSKNINYFIVTETLKLLPQSILDKDNHVFEQEPLYDHRHQLILLIIQNYVDKRLRHESVTFNDVKELLRIYFNKLTHVNSLIIFN